MSDSPRTFRVVPPAQRPVWQRRTARVIVVDDAGRVLLFGDSDPGIPGTSWWITPGGGVDAGESDVEAAVREVAEETGLRIGVGDLVGPVLTRHVVHGYSDVVIEQDDVFFAVWARSFAVSVAGHTQEEQITMTAHRWWTRADLAATAEEIWPANLLAILAEAEARRGTRQAPPLDGGTVEESTVPV